jgi:hypothetical protein
MATFYYVHTGHRIGLDRFRRAVAILHALEDEEITLLTSDFRIAQIARDFGIKNCVGIDVVRNIPNIAENGDKLLFDSNEANPIMLEDMRNYFSSFIRINDAQNDTKETGEFLISPYLEGEDILHVTIVDDKYFEMNTKKKDVAITYFFGDDDYEKDLEKHFDFIEGMNVYLQLGFYYFLDYETMLEKKFINCFTFEEYDMMIERTKILLSASPQAILDSLASGGKPIYIQREDYTEDFLLLFEKLNIPIIRNYNKKALQEIVEKIDTIRYTQLEQNSYKVANFIKNSLNL